MKRMIAVAAVVMLASQAAVVAHVTVRPRESEAGAEERYTVRVPTEGDVTTTSVHLEIPDGVTVLEVETTEGATFETQTREGRIVGITWTKAIKPKETSEFSFRARNPASGAEVTWKAHQHFSDGTVSDWTGPAGDRRPASITKLP
jgi:uncharacterized protein YcnI